MNTGRIKTIVGQRCWYVSAGGVTWPSFVLVLGSMVPREQPLRNPEHTDLFRKHRGSIELLVWSSWRLQSKSAVVVSSKSEKASAAQLDSLLGATVSDADCLPPAWDLSLLFSNGLALQVFADNQGPNASPSQNWELWLPGTYVAAGPGETWVEESNNTSRND